MYLQIEAERLKNYVLKIYPCKHDFELKVIDKRPKTLNGSYTVQTKKDEDLYQRERFNGNQTYYYT